MAFGLMRRKVMEATESHACDIDGESWVIRAGERLIADHPAVKTNPGFFAEAGPGREVTDLAPERMESKPPRSEPRVRAKRSLRFRGAQHGAFWGEGETVIQEGDTLPRSHPFVREQPQAFGPIA